MTIFGIGTVVVDHAVLLERFPEPDTKIGVVRDWKQVGGPVPVALSTAAFYGQPCTFMGRWGTDAAGQFVQRQLGQRGIDLTASVSHDDWSTGFAQVWTEPDGRRTIAYSRGDFPLPSADDVLAKQLAQHNVLHLDGWAGDAAIAAARLMKEQGGTVVLDAGSVKPGLDELLPLVDILIASALFRQSHFGSTSVSLDQLLGLNCDSVITTNGSDGASWYGPDQLHHHSGFSVNAIDTNGAGDIFSGAILDSINRGLTRYQALEHANAVAALSCTHYGNSTLPAPEEIAALIASKSSGN